MDMPTLRSDAPLLSIVIATYQRRAHLQCCLEWIQRTVGVSYELVIVDGGSEDDTVEWAGAQPHTRVLVERERAGCCRAYDMGLRAARGEFVMWLNDDSYPLEGTVDAGLRLLTGSHCDRVGMVAFYHTHRDHWNELDGFDQDGVRFGMLHVRGTPYANFGMLRRELLARLGYLDTDYRFCGWDPDLSLKVQRDAGRLVIGLPQALVWHEEHIDERKEDDARTRRRIDNERLFAKWRLPAKGSFADPLPAYREQAASVGVVPAKDVAQTPIAVRA